MSKWRVALATDEDMDWVMQQCEAFIQFIDTPVPYDEESLRELFSSEGVHIIIAHNEGVRKGMGIFMIGAHPFNKNILAFTEIAWWVPEEFRHSRAGLILLDAMCRLGEPCQVQTFALLHNSPVADRALTKRNFMKQEQTYMRNIQ